MDAIGGGPPPQDGKRTKVAKGSKDTAKDGAPLVRNGKAEYAGLPTFGEPKMTQLSLQHHKGALGIYVATVESSHCNPITAGRDELPRVALCVQL